MGSTSLEQESTGDKEDLGSSGHIFAIELRVAKIIRLMKRLVKISLQ